MLAVTQDMTITREDFLRSLPAAVGTAFTVNGQGIASSEAQRPWRIELTALDDLRLGRFVLPRHRVRIFLTGYGATETKRFLDRFELPFRRAGG